MPPSAVEIRSARPADLPSLAVFIARANAPTEGQCLHCPHATLAAIRLSLRSSEDFPGGWERAFVVGTESTDDEVVAAFGCQPSPDGTIGYLWGPWVSGRVDGWTRTAPALLAGLLARLPASTRRIDAFLHAENRAGLRFLESHGFRPGPLTHVYIAPRPAGSLPADGDPPCPPLRPAHEVAFARLHAATFPAVGSTPAEDLLAGRNETHAIFAATDGLRLLGSVCVSVNHAPREGFIDYLAVKPVARGQGIGAALLHTALRWAFDERGLPQVALTVSDWRAGARRLYEHAGFRRHASGVAMRRPVAFGHEKSARR